MMLLETNFRSSPDIGCKLGRSQSSTMPLNPCWCARFFAMGWQFCSGVV